MATLFLIVIAETFNAKLIVAREMPILAMLEEIYHQVIRDRCQLEIDTSKVSIQLV